jgi:hypothetical protein
VCIPWRDIVRDFYNNLDDRAFRRLCPAISGALRETFPDLNPRQIHTFPQSVAAKKILHGRMEVVILNWLLFHIKW